jgi:hypothetical protein
VDIDNTPPQWFAIESGNQSAWTTFTDAWSWVRFAWGRYQTADDDELSRPLLIGLLVALFAWLAWSIMRRPSQRESTAVGKPKAADIINGADSEFYRIERLLEARGLGRQPSEPVSEWLARLARTGQGTEGGAGQADVLRMDELRAIAQLHYRLRFDPIPMDAAMRNELRVRSERWLKGAIV